jgi:hypothetical protein
MERHGSMHILGPGHGLLGQLVKQRAVRSRALVPETVPAARLIKRVKQLLIMNEC